MKSKKILTILLSLAIMFTFMPAMAFADTYEKDATPTSGAITSITWGADYHTASVKVESAGVTSTYNFDYFDTAEDAMPATKADVTKHNERLVVMPGNLNNDGTVTYTLGKVTASDGVGANQYDWLASTFTAWSGMDFTYTAPAKVANMSKTVFDAYFLAEQVAEQSVDAGTYGAWYVQKDLADAKRTETSFDSFENTTLPNATHLAKSFFEVTYPAYDAYEFDTVNNKNVDKELAITVALKADAIKAKIDNDALVSTATGSVKLVPKVTVANHPFYTANIYDEDEDTISSTGRGWYVEDNESFNINYDRTYDNYITYDGASHKVAFVNEPKGVTVKYYVTQGNKNGAYVAPTAADWTTTFPETIKDAGTYYVALQFVTNKDNTTFNENGATYTVVTVGKASLPLEFKQDVLRVEYGKYDATAIEAAIKNMVIAPKAADVADKVNEAVQKYATVKGLFEDAGANTVYVVFNYKALSDDKELSEALKNYTFDDDYGMRVIIEKADNDTNLKAVTKSFKAKKKTKKLAKKKTFKLSATADFGTVLFKKVSGNAKITVSSAGKVTVKKGLKKGTYNVKVKAYTKGTANYAAGSDTQTIVVKIK